MTVEVTVEETQMVEKVVEATEKVVNGDAKEEELGDSKPKTVEKSSSYREESDFLSDLKEFERNALNDLKSKLEEAILGNCLFKKEEAIKSEEAVKESEEKEKATEQTEKDTKEIKEGQQESEKPAEEEGTVAEEEKKPEPEVGVEGIGKETDKDIALWGVPLLPSKCTEGTDVVLLKFLRAREFKVNEAFEMLKKTLEWRKEAKIDSVLEEKFEADLSAAAYMSGTDREGHPVCYNIYGVYGNEELYQKALGTEEKREQFLRWRFQLMEKGIQKLDLKPGGVSSLLQINDLKNAPGPSKKELRSAMKKAVTLLQDNYPEFVARNIFINVPFWYYALNALLSPFLTQRTKSKFVVVRPANVTEILLKYIPIEEIPIQYGGFKREDDLEFSGDDVAVSEVTIKPNSTETVEIQADGIGSTLIWDLAVLGWEVNYKEEFVPSDEGSYTIIVKKGKKMGSQEGPIRNTYRTNEAGKVVLTIENVSTKKKKVFYRYKINR